MDIIILRIGTVSYVSGKSPALQLFCVDKDGSTVYVNVPYPSIYLLTFPQPVDDTLLETVKLVLEPQFIRRSDANPNAVIVSGLDDNEGIMNSSYDLDLWTSAELNPVSERTAFSYISGITGEYISVRDYENIKRVRGQHLTHCDYEIRVSPFNIAGLPDQGFKRKWSDYAFLYDIEVYTPYKDFVDANRQSDEITSISGVSMKRDGTLEAFIYTNKWTNFDPASMRKEKLFSQGEFGFIVKKFDSEKDLLNAFFQTIRLDRPTCIVDYNGLTFDMPYIRTRAKRLGVSMEDLSMIRDLNLLTENVMVKTSIQTETLEDVNLPGVPHIDLIYYYRAMLPHLPNHRLETVSSRIIGQGKTGMSIAEFYKALETQNPDLLRDAAEYSLRDSIALVELWNRDASVQIFKHAANAGVNPDRVYAMPEYNTFKYLAGKVDLGYLSDSRLSTRLNVGIRKPLVGIYANTYTYTYAPLLKKVHGQYNPRFIEVLSEAPNVLTEYVFYHPVTGNVRANEEVKSRLIPISHNTIMQSTGLVMIDVPINYLDPVEDGDLVPYLRLIQISPMTVFTTQSSRLELSRDNVGNVEVIRHGTGETSKPKYKLLAKFTESIILTYALTFNGIVAEIPFPLKVNEKVNITAPTSNELKQRSFDEFLIKVKIQFSAYYSNSAQVRNKKSLALQMEGRYPGISINNMTVTYVMTPAGAQLYEENIDEPENYNIDYGYYQKALAKVVKLFNDFVNA